MQTPSRFLALAVAGGAIALAACGGPSVSPASSTALPGAVDPVAVDGTVATSFGNGPGQPANAAPCTHECDGTGQGPGPAGGYGDGPGAGPGGGLCGAACTGPVGPDPADILAVLGEALQEEHRAEMLYRSVLEDYPGAPPFAAIAASEARHVEALQWLFTRRQQAPAPSIWTPASFAPFSSIPAACAAGVDAETADGAFYGAYLARTDLPQDVRAVFTNLRAASLENHLPAFARCR